MKKEDWEAAKLYWTRSRKGGAGMLTSIRLLRDTFDLSLEDAKRVWAEAELGMSLEAHQQRLIPVVEELLRLEEE